MRTLNTQITDNDFKLINDCINDKPVNVSNFNSIKIGVLFTNLPWGEEIAIYDMNIKEITTVCIYYMLDLISIKDALSAFIMYKTIIPRYNSSPLTIVNITEEVNNKKKIKRYKVNFEY